MHKFQVTFLLETMHKIVTNDKNKPYNNTYTIRNQFIVIILNQQMIIIHNDVNFFLKTYECVD